MQTKEFRKRISTAIFLLGTLFSVSYAANQTTMDLSLNIVNTFSGSFEINGTSKTTGGITYINHNPTLIRISSDVAGSYLITGDFVGGTISGAESSSYITSLPLILTNNNMLNTIHLQFFKGNEVFVYPTISLKLDTTAPSKPTLTIPSNNSITTGFLLFSRSNSSDTGAGYKDFTLLISTDAGFTNNISTNITPNNEVIINTNILPNGKLYWMVIAQDELGNTSSSDIGYFCNQQNCSTTTNGGTSSQGGGYSIGSAIKLTQLIQEAQQNDKEIETTKPLPTIESTAKKLYSAEQIAAYKYAYGLGITTQGSISKANLGGTLIRKDLAKMISEYAIKVVNKKPNNNIICGFEDTTSNDLEIQYYTKLACKLGLMGREADGIQQAQKFNPYQEVTRAQFATIFSRLLYGMTYNVQYGEKIDRYTKHLQALNKNNIITKIDTPQAKELRGRVMTMMMRADNDASKTIGHASAK